MRRLLAIIVLSMVVFTSCVEEDVPGLQNTSVSLNFKHDWDGANVSSANFNTIQYFNENNDELSIEKLRYLISDVTFHKTNGETIVIEGYNLVDVTNDENLTYELPVQIPIGTYSNVSFTFGFDNTDNIDGVYTDLNSASWNVPAMLGGGYHFMQLEGKFINNVATEQGYQYHAIRAVDNADPMNLVFQDTFFTVNLGEVIVHNNSSVDIKMNIAEWFKSPHQWNLNDFNSMLMPDFNAQVQMYDNGQDAFSLGTVN